MTGQILSITLTLVAYILARTFYTRAPLAVRRNLPPLVLGLALTALFFYGSHIEWAEYKEGTSLLVWCLAPATVALIIPLTKSKHLWRNAAPILGAIVIGCALNLAWTVLISRLLHAPPELEAALRPKTSTAAVAAEVAKRSGGDPGAAAAFSVICGLLGSWIYPILGRRNSRPVSLGIAVGTVSHGIGTSRLAAEAKDADGTEATGASGFAMAAAAIVTALLGLGWMR